MKSLAKQYKIKFEDLEESVMNEFFSFLSTNYLISLLSKISSKIGQRVRSKYSNKLEAT